MKVRLIPLVAAVASVVSMSAHAKGPIDGKVYGKLRLSADYVKTETGTGASKVTDAQNVLKSHASRIGFKGKTALQDYSDLNVIYQAEYGIDGQVNNGNNWSARNTFVGLQGGFGTLLAGRHDTPMKGSQGKVDQFNDLDGDLASIFNGEDRLNQLVMYNTPAMGPLKASVAYIMSNKSDSNVKNQPNRNGVSAAVTVDQGMFYGAVAYNADVNNMNTLRVTGVVKPISNVQLGAMWQRAKCNDTASTVGTCTGGLYGAGASDSENGYLLSAGYSIGKATLKAEYGTSDLYKITSKAKYQKDMSVGADYKLGAKTKLEGWVTQLKNSDAHLKTTYVALGMEHKF